MAYTRSYVACHYAAVSDVIDVQVTGTPGYLPGCIPGQPRRPTYPIVPPTMHKFLRNYLPLGRDGFLAYSRFASSFLQVSKYHRLDVLTYGSIFLVTGSCVAKLDESTSFTNHHKLHSLVSLVDYDVSLSRDVHISECDSSISSVASFDR